MIIFGVPWCLALLVLSSQSKQPRFRMLSSAYNRFQESFLWYILLCFDFSFAFRISTAAHIYYQSAFLPEFFKFIDINDVTIIFTDTDNAVLIYYNFFRHIFPVTETSVKSSYQIRGCKGSALDSGVLISGMGQQNAAIYIFVQPPFAFFNDICPKSACTWKPMESYAKAS